MSTLQTMTLEEQFADDINCERPFSTCYVCYERWFRGTCPTPRITLGAPGTQQFCYHEEASSNYWKHIRESKLHKEILRLKAISLASLLDALPETLLFAKQHQKLLEDPAFRGLQRLFQ